MHTDSLPPGDRDDAPEKKKTTAVFPCDTLLRRKLLDLREQPGWSNNKIAAKCRVNSSIVSQYLSDDGCKYPGDIDAFERRAGSMLRDESLRAASGIETVDCDFAAEIASHFEYIRKTNDIGAVFAESGTGKSRAKEVCKKNCDQALIFDVRCWHRNESALRKFFFDAAPKGDYDSQTNWMDYAVLKLRGSDVPFIIDDAHKLPIRSLQLIADFYDETNCPVMLIGTLALQDHLAKDPQLYSRVGLGPVIGERNPELVIKHIIASLAPDIANGERSDIYDLCLQVVKGGGHLRAVYKQVKLAVQMKRDSAAGKPLVAYFHAAHLKLLRNYKLN